jgi:DNA-binding CsgD family transcriptional regulator
MAVAEHLVGRAAELSAFEDTLAGLDAGYFSAVEVAGEPGIGKTRLLSELGTRGNERGHLVLTGAASELEQDVPFAVFSDALDDYVGSLPPARLTDLDDEVRAELGTVLPSVRVNGQKPASQLERYRSYRAVRHLLELLAEPQAVVLLLDDLHWGDPASLELVGSLLRRPPAAPVLLALAVRPSQIADRLSTSLERASRAGTLLQLELPTLTAEESRELVGRVEGAPELYAASGGNPFYLEQLARVLDRPSVPLQEGAELPLEGVEVPPAVAAALAEELAVVSPEARRVLDGASVAGDPFELELAAAAAAMTEEAVMSALDELLSFDLVRHADAPRRFRFRHPLVRRAVYDNAPGGWRIGAHERAAQALEAQGASVTARAHHVERSARSSDAAAVESLREAGAATAEHAPASAARWFGAALRLLPESAPDAQRVELLSACAGSLAASGQFEQARSALLESLALVPDASVALRVGLTTACAGVEHLLGLHDEAHDRLMIALRGLEDPASPEAVALMIELSVDGFYRMEYEPMYEWGRRAVNAARQLHNRPLLAAALADCAYAATLNGAMKQAAQLRTEATELVDSLPDDELALRLDAVVNLGATELDLECYTDAGDHAERAMAIGRETGQSDLVPVLVYCLAWVTRRRGQLAESGELLDGAVEAARLSGNVQSLAGNLLNQSLTALAAGDIELALATAEESFELTRQLDRSLVSASAGNALAAALVEAGNPGRAAEVLVGRSGGVDLPLIPNAWRPSWLELLTRCWLALDRLDDAKRSAASAEACAARFGLRLAAAMAHRATAVVALASHEPDRAAERALASAAAAEEVGAPVEAALSRTLAGRAFAQAGRPEQAVTELRRAAVELHRFGALRYRDATERELGKLGRRIHRRTRPAEADSGIGSLTGRELEVARLVVNRKTNPEIAEELFLSKKTVETHLRNIFRKLDVSSRVELARAVEAADRERDRLSAAPLRSSDATG